MIKFANVTLYSETATYQDAFKEWILTIVGELSGPEGQMPSDDEVKAYVLERFRDLRQTILRDSDWTDLPHCPLDARSKQAYIQWRQELRDLPQVYDDLREASFPEPPY